MTVKPALGPALDVELASRLAGIALSHISREYPNRLDHVLNGPEDLKSPRALHPLFYGSFDWHSSVHSYWLLARLDRLYKDLPEGPAIGELFAASFTEAKISGECAYLQRPSAQLFERPYGWGWLLMLQAELMRGRPAEARKLKPLAARFVARFKAWLGKATYPNRAGTHGNSAFALALALDYAETAKDRALAARIGASARAWYGKDRAAQAWEPSGEDFLSPTLMEAECMRRVLDARQFGPWFRRFLPQLDARRPASLLRPAVVSDRKDGRIVHLDGLNLSRAWCWRQIAETLAAEDPRRKLALAAARRHLRAGLPAIAGDYMGEHWLASFALLALTPDSPLRSSRPRVR
jgi:Protein of unknown function (DUF2891)